MSLLDLPSDSLSRVLAFVQESTPSAVCKKLRVLNGNVIVHFWTHFLKEAKRTSEESEAWAYLLQEINYFLQAHNALLSDDERTFAFQQPVLLLLKLNFSLRASAYAALNSVKDIVFLSVPPLWAQGSLKVQTSSFVDLYRFTHSLLPLYATWWQLALDGNTILLAHTLCKQGMNATPTLSTLSQAREFLASCDGPVREELTWTGSLLPVRELSRIAGLKTLRLSTWKLGETGLLAFPPGLSEWLPCLTQVDLSHNRGKILAERLSQLSSVQVLQLSFNSLDHLPGGVFQLTHLHTLNLSGNRLRALSPHIGKLTSLKQLQMAGNLLAGLPEELSSLSNLRAIDFRSNKFVSFPSVLCKLKELREIDLGDNSITSLPLELGELPNLESLRVFNNRLRELPACLASLQHLTEVVVFGNRLTSLPPFSRPMRVLEICDNSSLRLKPEVLLRLKQNVAHLCYGPKHKDPSLLGPSPCSIV